MPQNNVLDPLLDRAWEDKPLAEIMKASPCALQGVTTKQAEALASMGIQSIEDMATHKAFLAAQALLILGRFNK